MSPDVFKRATEDQNVQYVSWDELLEAVKLIQIAVLKGTCCSHFQLHIFIHGLC